MSFKAIILIIVMHLLSAHVVNISVTTLTLTDDSHFQLEIRTDRANLEKAVLNSYGRVLSAESVVKKDIAYMIKYHWDHIRFTTSDGQEIKLKYSKKTYDEEWVSIFYTGMLPRPSATIIVHNTFMLEQSKDQANIVRLYLPDGSNTGRNLGKNNVRASINPKDCKIEDYHK